MFIQPRIRIEGQTFNLLETEGTPNREVFGSDPPTYTTKTGLKIEQKQTGNTCKWTVVTKNGDKYEFDQVRVIEEKDGKKKHAVLITKVTDVEGNYVTYSYEGNENRLKWIKSSDNRVIEMVYNRDGTLECAVANSGSKTTKKRIIYFKYRSISGSNLKYLYRVGVRNAGDFYWEFDELAGVYRHSSNTYARRCTFGQNARLRHPLGRVAEYKTKKIVNFGQATPPDGHLGTSHRSSCIPPASIVPGIYITIAPPYNLVTKITPTFTYLAADGTSSYGKFYTFFTSAVVEKKVVDPDLTTAIWKFSYDEGDLFNPGSTTNKTVHKNPNSPVNVDIRKPKTRTIVDPEGTKTVLKIGRSLTDSGLLLSKKIYPKGSATPTFSAEYSYVSSKKRLGYAWNRDKLNQKGAEHWTRQSKEVQTVDGVKYTTEWKFDDYGYPTKKTLSSTLQSGSIVEKTTYSHKTSKWILGLVATHSVNGKISKFTYDGNGKVLLETRMGSEFMRYRWVGGKLVAERNGGDETTKYSGYKRGISTWTTLPNGARYTANVDDNGWITQTTSPSGNIEKFSHNPLGWVTLIDRIAGYADTTITYTAPSDPGEVFGFPIPGVGVVRKEVTGTGTSKKENKTTYNGSGLPILIETRDVTNNVTIFTRVRYDSLGRETFRSFPSFQSTATAGIETKYDELNRKIQERENVSPFATRTFTYLNNNVVRTTDAEGNSTTVHRSGYGSPDDGRETKILEANGRITTNTYDKMLNLIEKRTQFGGRIETSIYKYNSLNQLCMETHPFIGTKSTEYNDAGRVSRVEFGVSPSFVCPTPKKIIITSLVPWKECTTTSKWVLTGGWREPEPVLKTVTTCKDVYRETKIEKANSKETTESPTPTPAPTPTPNPIPTPNTCPPGQKLYNNECISELQNPFLSEAIEKGILISYSTLGKVTKVNYPSDDTPDISTSHDQEGRVTKIEKGNVKLTYTYGKRGELLSETLTIIVTDTNNNKTTKKYTATYTYNQTGGIVTYKTPGNRTIKYVLNAFNQPTGFTFRGYDYISNVTYHANGEVKTASIHNANSSKNSETIDLSIELNSRQLRNRYKLMDGDDEIFYFSLTHDKNRRVKMVAGKNNNSQQVGQRTYTFNNVNQIISLESTNTTISYTFDGFGNFLKRTEGSKTQTNSYDSKTRLIKSTRYEETDSEKNIINTRTDSLKHDSFGRPTKIGNLALTFDDSDKLVGVVKTSNENINQSNLYDGNHNRVYSLSKITKSSYTQHVSKYEFVSKNGVLLHRFVAVNNVTGNRPHQESVGGTDIVKFSKDLSLVFGDCPWWNISNRSNNYEIVLNTDHSIISETTVDAIGKTIDSKGTAPKNCNLPSNDKNSEDEEDEWDEGDEWNVWAVSKGVTSLLSNGLVQNNLNNQRKMTPRYIFNQFIRDTYIDIYFLRDESYYSANLGMHINPKNRLNHEKDSRYYENRYAITDNVLVNPPTSYYGETNALDSQRQPWHKAKNKNREDMFRYFR